MDYCSLAVCIIRYPDAEDVDFDPSEANHQMKKDEPTEDNLNAPNVRFKVPKIRKTQSAESFDTKLDIETMNITLEKLMKQVEMQAMIIRKLQDDKTKNEAQIAEYEMKRRNSRKDEEGLAEIRELINKLQRDMGRKEDAINNLTRHQNNLQENIRDIQRPLLIHNLRLRNEIPNINFAPTITVAPNMNNGFAGTTTNNNFTGDIENHGVFGNQGNVSMQ